MPLIRTCAALLGVALITGCAMPAGTAVAPAAAKADEHAAHHPAAGASAPAGGPVHDHMKAMREMHDKMMNARTPEERQALMAEHMKAMQEGMQMMKGMGGSKTLPADMSQRQQMLEGRMDMMQAMMEMMMQRLPAASAAPVPK